MYKELLRKALIDIITDDIVFTGALWSESTVVADVGRPGLDVDTDADGVTVATS
jgi:hypothetical protein